MSGLPLRALTWNLFHGRDHPPDPALYTWRSRLLRGTERDDTHVQVNRDLFGEFARRARRRRLGRRAAAGVPAALGARRSRGPRGAAAAPRAHLAKLARAAARPARPPQPGPDRLERGRLQPDPRARRRSLERRELVLDARPAARAPRDGLHPRRAHRVRRRRLRRQPARERRRRRCAQLAEREVLLAAGTALEWAGEGTRSCSAATSTPPGRERRLRAPRARARARARPRRPTRSTTCSPPGSSRRAPAAWPPERREVATADGAIRLSDHAPVTAAFG